MVHSCFTWAKKSVIISPCFTRAARWVILFLLAFVVRLTYISVASLGPGEIQGDASQYYTYAQNLTASGTYVEQHGNRAIRMPGYPLFLAGVFRLFGSTVSTIQCVQAILSAISVLLITLAAFRYLSAPWAWAAGTIAIFYYDFFAGCPRILSETLYVFLLTGFLSTWSMARDRNKVKFFLSGILLGLCMLVRPEIGLFIGCVGFILVLKHSKRGVLFALLLWIGAGTVLAPWVLRNRIVMGKWIVTTSSMKFNAYVGLWLSQKRLGLVEGNWLMPVGQEVERDRAYGEAARDLYRKTPLTQIIKIYFYNLAVLFYPFHPTYDPTLWFFLPFWIYALYLFFVRQAPVLVIPAVYVTFSAGTFILFGCTVLRYREPLAPAVILLAAFGLCELWRRTPRPTFAKILSVWIGLNAMAWAMAPRLRLLLLDGKAHLW
jgi:hypothetical protein